ncbi:uncharacterized protein IUM83_10999 [Phytophthora cinnamomi]|uniref:uncharacterized protein n=1 Tax=Phytophthora cinnamomi TaxID=4785 RepID=UPI003559EC12|nr:hypothetical protein IUM83_10999 [Phytophthora cinnamomi]
MEAKLLKQSIDEKANVDVMDDGGDEGDRVEDEDEDEQPDLCVYGDNVGSGTGVERTCSSSASTESVNSVETRGFSEVGAGSAYVPTGESVGDLSELLDSAAVRDGLEAFASTPRPPTSGRPIEPTPSLSWSQKAQQDVDRG